MMDNPWNIQSIYDLQYFNCPTCEYRNHSKQEFVNHAYDFHPKAIEYLANVNTESLIDIVCPWDAKIIKKEEYDDEKNSNYPINSEYILNNVKGNFVNGTNLNENHTQHGPKNNVTT